MDTDSKIEMIKKGTLEVITEEELREKIETGKTTAYIGYEPSGKIHLGHVLPGPYS